MTLSAFDMYSIGIGPSSSLTVGPMRAARAFADSLSNQELARTHRVAVNLYGSLGATGRGHGSEKAVMLGLEGDDPATLAISTSDARVDAIRNDRSLRLRGAHPVSFDPKSDLVLHRRKSLPQRPNGMTFEALDRSGRQIVERTYFSVGGGFIVEDDTDGPLNSSKRTPSSRSRSAQVQICWSIARRTTCPSVN